MRSQSTKPIQVLIMKKHFPRILMASYKLRLQVMPNRP